MVNSLHLPSIFLWLQSIPSGYGISQKLNGSTEIVEWKTSDYNQMRFYPVKSLGSWSTNLHYYIVYRLGRSHIPNFERRDEIWKRTPLDRISFAIICFLPIAISNSHHFIFSIITIRKSSFNHLIHSFNFFQMVRFKKRVLYFSIFTWKCIFNFNYTVIQFRVPKNI